MNYTTRQSINSSSPYVSHYGANRSYTTQRSQQGATLIIVLMVVLLLAIIGTISVKNSQVSLNMTTSSQVNQLLMQSSDVPLAKLELSSVEPGANNFTQLQNMAIDDTGPIGMLTREGHKGLEYVLCYRPASNNSIYSRGTHRVVLDATGSQTKGLRTGYCNLENSTANDNYYTSARQTVASQVSITRPTLAPDQIAVEIPPLSVLNEGTDVSTVGKSEAAYFRSYVTSLAPTLAISSTVAAIDGCLQLPIGGLAGTALDDNQNRCLGATDTPVNIQVQDYAYNIPAI